MSEITHYNSGHADLTRDNNDSLLAEYHAERALWASVLLQAFRDLIANDDLTNVHKGDSAGMAVRESAFRWINEKVTYGRDVDNEGTQEELRCEEYHTRDVGGFEWICEVLDLDPNVIRMQSLSTSSVKRVLGTNMHGSMRVKARLE